MRKPIIAANWKMNKKISEVEEYGKILLKDLPSDVEPVVIPPFTHLQKALEIFKDTPVKVGAQNLYPKESGAYTGEISPVMLKELGVTYVVLGHSERRMYFGESDAFINEKVKAAFQAGLKPILCLGETLDEKEAGHSHEICLGQLEEALEGVRKEEAEELVIAYEPVWAIGTGKSASSSDAQEIIGSLRERLKEIYGPEVSEQVRIQYGGSVKPTNISEFMKEKDIDGSLVGGAALDPQSFAEILKNA